MSAERRFGTVLFGGFRKSDVNVYLERLLREYEDKLKQKEDEISTLKNQGQNLKTKYDELLRRSDQINNDRTKIADVLIKAQEKAEIILEEARQKAMDEKKSLEYLVEGEKEKLVDIKQELKDLRAEVINKLRKFENQINEMIGDDQGPEAAEKTEDADEAE